MFLGALQTIGSYALPKLAQFGLDLAKTAARRVLGQSQSPYVKTLGDTATKLIDTFGNDMGIAQPDSQRPSRRMNRNRSQSMDSRRQKQRSMMRQRSADWQDQQQQKDMKPLKQKMIQQNDYEEQF